MLALESKVTKVPTMETVKRTTLTVGTKNIEVFVNDKSEYFFNQTQLEQLTESGERSVRDFLANKSPEALRCKGSNSGKSAKVLGDKANVKLVSLLVTENYLLFKVKQGNQGAADLIGWYSGLGLYTACHTAFGNKVVKDNVNMYNALRDLNKKQYHPLLTSWLKSDVNGDSSLINWGREINLFKAHAGLPQSPVTEYDQETLDKMNRAEVVYNAVRKRGFNHKDALGFLP